MVSDRARRRIERLLDQMDEAADQKDWSLVREHAKDVLALRPDLVLRVCDSYGNVMTLGVC